MELYNKDCFNVFPKIQNNTIDLVVVDLPYNQTACEWDVGFDLNLMWIELKRICKPNTTFCFFTTTKFGNKLINSNPKWFRYDLVMEKSKAVGFLSSKKMPLRSHEMIYIFGNPSGGKKIYNVQKTQGAKPYDKGIHSSSANIYGLDINETAEIEKKNIDGSRFPRSVMKTCSSNVNLFHPTQKPVEILEFLIKSYSNEGDTVLDFCMGSGSTGEASKKNSRFFIGIEMNKEYFDKASKRLEG